MYLSISLQTTFLASLCLTFEIVLFCSANYVIVCALVLLLAHLFVL